MKTIIGLFFMSFYCSCNMQKTRPPENIVVKAPTSVSSAVKPGEWLLLFRLTKADGLWYKYDTTITDVGLKKIDPLTTANIITTLDEVEKTYHVRLDSTQNILLQGDADIVYEQFKKIKEALKQKQVFKFRIVTNDN